MGSSEPTEAAVTTTTPDTATTTAASGPTPATTTAASESGRSGNPQGSSGPETASLDEPGIRCECLMNARYHAAREAFLDTVHRWFMFAVIAFGAGALVDVFPKEFYGINLVLPVKETFAALTAIIAALDLTFDLSNRARAHALMKRRYFELAADILEGKRSLTEALGCLNRYSADEEPAYYALLMASWNAAQEMVYGTAAYSYEIPPSHLRFKNVRRFGGKPYKFRGASPAAPA